MKTKNELMRTSGFWLETIQNDIFRMIDEYLYENKMSGDEFAENFGYSKRYVMKILNGEFNYTLEELINLCINIGKTPNIEFKNFE